MKHQSVKEKTSILNHGFSWFKYGIIFSLLYWIIESARWALLNNSVSLNEIIFPTTSTLLIRLLMVGLIFLFSLLAPGINSILRQRQQIREKSQSIRLILINLIFCIAYWLLSLVQQSGLGQEISSNSLFWIRIEAVFVFLLFGTYAQIKINMQSKQVEQTEAEIQRLQQLLFDMPHAICLLNISGEVTVANFAFKKLLTKLIAPRPDESHREAVTRFVQVAQLEDEIKLVLEGKSRILENVSYTTHTDDERNFELSLFPVHDSLGAVSRIGITWREITEQVQAEEHKNLLQAELIHAQKMDAIGMLAGGIAHDFNNLITAILGSAEMAMMDTEKGSSLHEDLRQIILASERASSLTRQLLLFSRKHHMQRKSQSLNSIIDNLLKMLYRLVGEPITMIDHLDGELWPAELDQGTIEQAIVNIIVNARNAMPDGGEIVLTTKNIITAPESGAGYVGDTICLTIEDTGCGMDKNTLERIFEPFYTTRKGAGGTGLGLSVVHGIIQEHGGWLKVDSKPDKGTRFELYFPATELSTIESNGTSSVTEPMYGHGERILVVEDDAAVRRFTIHALKKHGYLVKEAENATKARQLIAAEQHGFDLLLSDLVLPDQSGLDLAKSLMQQDATLRCILGSGYFDREQDENASADASIHFLRKPYDLCTLLGAVHETLKNN